MTISVFVTGGLQVNTLIVPLNEKQVFVVDPGGDVPLILKYLQDTQYEPVALVCTHGHFDHVFGVNDFLDGYNKKLPVVIHSGDECYISSDREIAMEAHDYDLKRVGLTPLLSAFDDMPGSSHLLAEGETLCDIPELSDIKEALQWQVLYTPGHSKGSICLYNRMEGILISGDTLFYGGYGRTDMYNSEPAKLASSLKRLHTLPPETVVYPGHGEVGFHLSAVWEG